MDKYTLYDFYLEFCVDTDKGEIPLSFKEWEREIYPKDIGFLKRIGVGYESNLFRY